MAAVREGQLLAEVSWLCRSQHSRELLPRLVLFLQHLGSGVGDITSIVVTRGPGNFSGLRVGVTTAKGLAFSCGVPLVAVSTLEVMAYSQAAARLPVCAVLDAGRGEVAGAVYIETQQGWGPVIGERLSTLQDLLSEVPLESVFCGKISPDQLDLIYRLRGPGVRVASQAACTCRAGVLAELGSRHLKAGETVSPASLEPVYLRGPAISSPKGGTATRI